MGQVNYRHLQNGSDIRGISLEGVQGQTPNLTASEAGPIGYGFITWLASKAGKKPADLRVTIGRDPRISGPGLCAAFIKGAAAAGATVTDCGLATTPAMFMTTVFDAYASDGAVMISASHLPWNRNGFKFFDRDGGLQKEDITAILQTAEALDPLSAASTAGATSPQDEPPAKDTRLMTIYAAHLRRIITDKLGCQPESRVLAGLKIAVDAGNGSGGFFPSAVLAPLGADVSASKYLTPDGRFPNHIPNPENDEAIADLAQQVCAAHCDFGIIFDTDVDRCAAVDRQGHPINHDSIVALAACLIAGEHPGTTVVTDSITSDHLTDFLQEHLGLHHFRYRRGYKNVINKAQALNAEGIDCELAIETSGHAAIRENYFLDDGAYLATRIIVEAARLAGAGKTLDSLLDPLVLPKESREVRMDIHDERPRAFGDALLRDFAVWAEKQGLQIAKPNYEGVRLQFPSGWCLLRNSLHDPLMSLNMQSDKEGGTDAMAAMLKDFLGRYDALDTTAL